MLDDLIKQDCFGGTERWYPFFKVYYECGLEYSGVRFNLDAPSFLILIGIAATVLIVWKSASIRKSGRKIWEWIVPGSKV